jgi:RND family efflux transporter MFP subunit
MQLRTFAVAAALAVAAGCNGGGAAMPPGAQAFPPTPVQLAPAKLAPIEDATEYVATLKSLHSTSVQPQADGQITEIFVSSGDRVAQGARLVQIDPRRQQAAVTSQQAEVASREASVVYARQQAQRVSALYASGAVSKQEEEQADTALRTAMADLQALEAQVQQQEVQLRYYTVIAPTAGIVGDIPVRVGNQVTTQSMLTTIDQNQTLELYVSVPAERAGQLKAGLPIQMLSSDGSQRVGSTTIGFISPHVDDQTQTVLVKGTVKNADLTLRASQFVRARILWNTTQGLVVPVTAVLRVNGQFFAFIAEPADTGPGGARGAGGPGGPGALIARQRAIKVGEIAGDNYPVLDGIKPDERVVVSGTQKLADGAPISAAPSPAPGP